MIHRLVTLLKADTVKMGEQSVVVGPGASAGAAAGDSTAQEARIVESNDEYAVIEIVCGCGAKSFVQCNFGNQPSPATASQ
jgi:tRNA-dihydrouridine synthase